MTIRNDADLDATGRGAGCPFCALAPEHILMQSEHGLALLDAFPVANGHTLVVPHRHVPSLFALSDGEQADMWRLVSLVRDRLLHRYRPHGFTIGVNDGSAAGQTVAHAHIHLIPRFDGDVEDPRGGVRWVIPEKAAWWGPKDGDPSNS